MRTDNKGRLIKYLVTDLGIQIVTDDDERFDSQELPLFESFEEAAILSIEAMADRIAVLEGRKK